MSISNRPYRQKSTDELLSDLKTRKEEEKRLRIAAAEKLKRENPKAVNQSTDEVIAQLKNAQEVLTKEAAINAAEATLVKNKALEEHQIKRKEEAVNDNSKAQEKENEANQKRTELELGIKQRQEKRKDVRRIQKKMARREKETTEQNKEKYEFRTLITVPKIHCPSQKMQYTDKKTSLPLYTLVTIDVYEENGYIAYTLVASKPEMFEFTTNVKAPSPFVPATFTTQVMYDGTEYSKTTIKFTPELTQQVKNEISRVIPDIDMAGYSVTYKLKNDLEEKNTEKKILTIYEKGGYLACKFPIPVVRRITNLIAPQPFVLDELLKEQILEAAAQAGHIPREDTAEEIRQARMESKSLDNRIKEHNLDKARREKENRLKKNLEAEARMQESKWNSAALSLPILTCKIGHFCNIDKDNESKISETMNQIHHYCTSVTEDKSSTDLEKTAATEIKAELSNLYDALNFEIPIEDSTNDIINTKIEDSTNDTINTKLGGAYNTLCGVIEKYQTEFLTIEVTEKLNEKSYRNLKIAIGLLSTLVTIIGGALGTVLGLTFAGPAGAIAGGVTGSIISGGIAYCLANTFFPPPPTTTHANTLAAKVMIEKSKELIKCAQENGFEDETGMKVYTFLTLPFRASL